MEERDVTGQTSGKIWHRNPTPVANGGLVVSLLHSGKGLKNGRFRRFLHAAFDVTGDRVITSDHLGGVYVFDLSRNRYALVQSCGQTCTAIASGLKRKHEYLVGLADSSVKCYTTENKELVSWMRGHESAVHSISVHSSGRYAITTSRDTAQMWDLDTFERMRKLNVRSEVPIQKVFFLPDSDTILTCFTDDSIFGWESDNFEWKFKLDPGSQQTLGYKTFSATRNCKVLACAGKSNLLHIYCLDTHKLIQVIKMPKEVVSVKQVEFLSDKFDCGSNKVLGVLSQDGVVRFIHICSCRVLFELCSPKQTDKISSVCASLEGSDHVVAMTEFGRFLIFSISSLCPDFNKTPGPLVKVVKDIWKRKIQSDKTQSTINSTTSRPVTRPVDRSISSGRIKGKKVKNEPEDPQDEDVLPNGLSLSKLKRVLRWRGEYPEQYRLFIWRSILQLPENQTAFDSLAKKGTHLAYAAIQERYPVKSGRLLRIMQRVLSALAHWSAIFSELEHLPLIAFPFIKLFQNNYLICFEMIATVLINWCQHWFEFFPNPPINVLSMVENLLSHHDKQLLTHFIKYEVTTQIYAWPLLHTFMSEVLSRDEWLRLFDNVFSNHPSFFLHCVAAYAICCRSALLKTTQTEDFKYFFHHRNALDIGAVINEAYRMAECTPRNINPKYNLDPFEPLPPGETYPIFNKYPKFIVDYQAQERERIRKDELDYLREKHIAQELTDQMEDRKLHEEAWYRKKEILQDAEAHRRQLLLDEDQKLIEQRKKLAAMKRELRIRELQLLDKSRMRFVDHQQTVKKIELDRLDDELRRKVRLREEESAAAIDDVEIKGLELEAQKAALEQQMAREQSELQDAVQNDVNKRRRLEELESKMHDKLKDGGEIDLVKARELEQDLASAELRTNSMRHRSAATTRLINGDIEREKSLARSLSRNIEHLKQQKHINEKLKALREEKDKELALARHHLRRLEKIQTAGDDRRARILQDGNMNESNKRLNESRERVDDHVRRLREECQQLRLDESLRDDGRMTAVSNGLSMYNASESLQDDAAPEWSLDRHRGNLDEEEMNLMEEVHNLRQRLISNRSARR